MADENLTKRFSLAADKQRQIVKDNAQPRIKPPQIARHPQPGLAPPGTVGITVRPGYVLGQQGPEKQPRKFSLKSDGDLSKEFKTVAPKPPRKAQDRDR